MTEWKIVEQLQEIEKRQNELYNLLVEIGGALPTEATETKPEEPVTDIAKARFVIERLTETSQANLELARQVHGYF